MRKIKIYGPFVILAVAIQSCFVAKNYERSDEVVKETYFRTDSISTDSLSIASLSWKEIFMDSKLTDYINTGLNNNLDIRKAIQNITVAGAYVKQGKAGYFPTLSLTGNYTYTTQSLNTQFGALIGERAHINQFQLSPSISWEADIWGKIRSTERAYAATFLQSLSAHQAVKSELVASLASTYYQLLSYDEQKRIIEATIENRIESLETIKSLKEAGNVTEAGVQQTEAQLNNARALLLDIENQIKLSENAFCILLGEAPHKIERGALSEQTINADINYGVPIQLLSNRPDVMASEYQLINAFELTNVARSQFYPSFTLTANGGFQSLDFSKLFSVNSLFASIVGGLTQPILNGRKIKTQYEVSKAQQESALITYRQTILNASREVSDALYTYKTNVDKMQYKQAEYDSYRKAVEYSEELLNYGMANYLEVLTAKESELNAQLSIVNLQYGRLNSTVQLYKALGGGWR